MRQRSLSVSRCSWGFMVTLAACGGSTATQPPPLVLSIAHPASPVRAVAGDGATAAAGSAPATEGAASIAPASQAAFAEGLELLAKNDRIGALAAFRAAATASAHNALAQYNAAVLLAADGKFSEARERFEAALAIDGKLGPAAIGVATELERVGEVSGAERLLRAHLGEQPAVGARLAQLLARRGALDEARAQAIAVLHVDERNAQAMLALGMVYRRQNKFELSQLAIEQALAIDASLGEAYNELGLVLVVRGEKAQAVLAFERAAQASPYLAAIHNNLGVLRCEVGAFKAAVESLDQATRLSPKRPEYYLNLGNALRGDQRYAEAEQAYKQALELGGGTSGALFNLGVLYLDNELPGQDVRTRLRASIGYLKDYAQKTKPSVEDQQRIDDYIDTAQKGIDNEDKRLVRERQRAEKDAEKKRLAEVERQEAERKAAAGSNAAAAPADDAGGAK